MNKDTLYNNWCSGPYTVDTEEQSYMGLPVYYRIVEMPLRKNSVMVRRRLCRIFAHRYKKELLPYMAILIFFIAHHYLSLFSQTFFQHRYGAHGAFTMSKGWERFFFIFTWITEGSSYLSPRAYAIMHRMHHAYADTDKDPHSPLHHKNVFAMMWATKTVYTNIFERKTEVEARFTKNLPDWDSFDRFAHSWGPRIFWAAAYTAFYIYFATSWWMFLLLPIHFTIGPIHGAIINWYAHKYGYKNFQLKSTAVNLMPVDIIMLGEGYHNNHHKRASHPNFGIRKYELDPVYPFIKLFNAAGIIKLKKLPEKFIETDF